MVNKKASKAHTPARSRPKIFIQSALFCERILREMDRVTSYIRVVDTIIVPVGHDEQADPSRRQVTLNAAISVVAEKSVKKAILKLNAVTPSGNVTDDRIVRLELPTPGAPFLIQMPTIVQPHEEGIYWFNVFINGELQTKMPLRVSFEVMK